MQTSWNLYQHSPCPAISCAFNCAILDGEKVTLWSADRGRDGSDVESAVPVAGYVGQGPCLELRKSATQVCLSRFWFPSRCFWDCLGFVRGFGLVLLTGLNMDLVG